jgi:hypothetical protein
MEKKNGKLTLSYVNKPLEFISYEFNDHEIQKTLNDESIKKTFKIMKNRKFSNTNTEKNKEESKDGQGKDQKGKKKVEEEEDDEEDEGKVVIKFNQRQKGI